MAESPPQQLAMTSTAFSVCASNRPKKKTPEGYVAFQEKYGPFTNDNEFLTIPEALEAVSTRTLSLLINDIVTRRLIGVCKDTMKEALKSLQILMKVIARRSDAMWDILLACAKSCQAY